MTSLGNVWDANETWLVLMGRALFGAFPLAYGTILTAVYIMLPGLCCYFWYGTILTAVYIMLPGLCCYFGEKYCSDKLRISGTEKVSMPRCRNSATNKSPVSIISWASVVPKAPPSRARFLQIRRVRLKQKEKPFNSIGVSPTL